jgi:tripartite-type tricarboxylate transporter receptor subunit TctC
MKADLRRRDLTLGLLGMGLLAQAPAYAQEWAPSKPVRIVVPIVGSTNDVLARMLAPKLQEALGQPVIVENRPGAGGNIGADMVAKAAPDGHTLLIGYNGPLAINVGLFDSMPYDPLRDLAPISLMVTAAQYLAVNPATGIQSVADLVARAKAHSVSRCGPGCDRPDCRQCAGRLSGAGQCAAVCQGGPSAADRLQRPTAFFIYAAGTHHDRAGLPGFSGHVLDRAAHHGRHTAPHH